MSIHQPALNDPALRAVLALPTNDHDVAAADLALAAEFTADFAAEFAAIQAESMGWQPLGEGAYLHQGDFQEEGTVIQVVGVPDAQMAGMNVLLLCF